MSRDWILSAMPLAVMLVSLGAGVIVDGGTSRALAGDGASAQAEPAPAATPARIPSGLAGIRIS